MENLVETIIKERGLYVVSTHLVQTMVSKPWKNMDSLEVGITHIRE